MCSSDLRVNRLDSSGIAGKEILFQSLVYEGFDHGIQRNLSGYISQHTVIHAFTSTCATQHSASAAKRSVMCMRRLVANLRGCLSSPGTMNLDGKMNYKGLLTNDAMRVTISAAASAELLARLLSMFT